MTTQERALVEKALADMEWNRQQVLAERDAALAEVERLRKQLEAQR